MNLSLKDTLKPRLFPSTTPLTPLGLVGSLLLAWSACVYAGEFLPPDDYPQDQIEIIEGEDRMIFEYRQNGVLTMIKVVPENGRPYYMVPADGAPHYESLDHKRRLYPQWVIVEW